MPTFQITAPSILLIVSLFLPGCAAPAPAQPQVETAPVSVDQPADPSAGQPAGRPTDQPAGQPTGEAKPAAQVDIRGRVLQSRRNSQGEPPVGTVRVEGTVEPGTRYAKAVIHVGHQTKIFLGRNGKPASFSFLHSGDLVEVTFTGPVAESDPVQATAEKIVILEHIP